MRGFKTKQWFEAQRWQEKGKKKKMKAELPIWRDCTKKTQKTLVYIEDQHWSRPDISNSICLPLDLYE